MLLVALDAERPKVIVRFKDRERPALGIDVVEEESDLVVDLERPTSESAVSAAVVVSFEDAPSPRFPHSPPLNQNPNPNITCTLW